MFLNQKFFFNLLNAILVEKILNITTVAIVGFNGIEFIAIR